MGIDIQVLHEALRAQLSEDEEYEGDLAVEKMGDEGFDWIVRELKGGRLPFVRFQAVRGAAEWSGGLMLKVAIPLLPHG